jgi:hypothetical protein
VRQGYSSVGKLTKARFDTRARVNIDLIDLSLYLFVFSGRACSQFYYTAERPNTPFKRHTVTYTTDLPMIDSRLEGKKLCFMFRFCIFHFTPIFNTSLSTANISIIHIT